MPLLKVRADRSKQKVLHERKKNEVINKATKFLEMHHNNMKRRTQDARVRESKRGGENRLVQDDPRAKRGQPARAQKSQKRTKLTKKYLRDLEKDRVIKAILKAGESLRKK